MLTDAKVSSDSVEAQHSQGESFPPGIKYLIDFVQEKHGVDDRDEARRIAYIYHFNLIQSAVVTFYTGFKDLSLQQPSEHSPEAYKVNIVYLAKCLVKHHD